MVDKKEAARDLFMAGWTHRQISDTIKIAPGTLTRWSKEDEWKATRLKSDSRKQNAVEQVEKLVDYQLKVLNLITAKMEQEIDNTMSVSELKKCMIERGDADALVKLLSTIKGREIEWDTLVKVVTELLAYAEANDTKAAKGFKNVANNFLNDKRQVL